MNTQSEKTEPRNHDLEVALVKIARALFDFVDSEESYEAIASIDPLIAKFQSRANDYVNATGYLHPDLGLELREWEMFKRDLLSPDHAQRKAEGKSNIDRRFVDNYGKTPKNIIKGLEQELGLAE